MVEGIPYWHWSHTIRFYYSNISILGVLVVVTVAISATQYLTAWFGYLEEKRNTKATHTKRRFATRTPKSKKQRLEWD